MRQRKQAACHVDLGVPSDVSLDTTTAMRPASMLTPQPPHACAHTVPAATTFIHLFIINCTQQTCMMHDYDEQWKKHLHTNKNNKNNKNTVGIVQFINARFTSPDPSRRDKTVEFRRVGRCELSRRQSAGIWNSLSNLPTNHSSREAMAVRIGFSTTQDYRGRNGGAAVAKQPNQNVQNVQNVV